jgi:esterase
MYLNYRVLGEGKPIVILHGFLGVSDNWQTFARSLAPLGFSVYLFDLRNHGLSPHNPEHTYAVMAADVAFMLSELKIHNPIIMGHSMGGKVTMKLANDFPNSMKAMIIVDIAPYAYPPHHQTIFKGLLSVDLNVIKTRLEADEKLAETITDLSMRQFLLKNLYWKEEGQLAWRFNIDALANAIEIIGEATLPDSPNFLPALFAYGEDSDYVNPTRISEISASFPSAKFIGIQGAGHWVHAQQPAKLQSVVLDFVKNLK